MNVIHKSHRIPWIDIAKGIGILLVVYGHSRLPHSPYVYLFHMPFFMLISGYLFQESRSFGSFFFRKAKTLYLPFVFWNLLVTAGLLLSVWYRGGFRSYLPAALKNMGLILLTFGKEGKYLGATWFLGSLFSISIVYKLLDTLFRKISHREYLLLGLFAGIALFGSYVTLPWYQSRTLVLSFFYAFGRCARNWQPFLDRCSGPGTYLGTAAAFLILAQFTNVSLAENSYEHRPIFVLCALLGSWSACELSRLIDSLRSAKESKESSASRRILASPHGLGAAGLFARALEYLGKRSMDILLWHFIAFRIVVAFQVHAEGHPFLHALFVNSRYNTSGFWWIAYFAVGILFPLLFGELLRSGPWGSLLRKCHLIPEA